jgi:hypothetical protein
MRRRNMAYLKSPKETKPHRNVRVQIMAMRPYGLLATSESSITR